MPCNYSGFTDPETTRGWAIIDFDWSNAKQIWAKHQPMDDEELLQQQVVLSTSSSLGQTVWVYRGSMWAYVSYCRIAVHDAPGSLLTPGAPPPSLSLSPGTRPCA